MNKKGLYCLLAVVLCSTAAVSGPLVREHVPSNAQWIVHVNIDAFLTSVPGTLLQKDMPEDQKAKINAMAQLLGTDVIKDIHGITLYGSEAGDENATALFYGKFDRQKLLAVLALNEAFSQGEYNGHSLYYWADAKGGKKQVGTFAADNMIVIGQQESSIVTALDVLDGSIERLSSQPENPMYKLTTAPSKTIFLAVAREIPALLQNNEQAAILKNSKYLSVACSETAGDMTLDIHMEVQDEVMATQVEQVVRGMIAFASIGQGDNPEIAALLNTVTLTREAKGLDLHVQYPSAKLYEIALSQADLTGLLEAN